MTFTAIENCDVSYLDALFFKDGLLCPVPATELWSVPQEHLSLFCVKHGLYQLPTVELVNYLRERIDGRTAIELGAGNGVFGRSLGIPMYDNKMQEWPEIKAHYAMLQQPTVTYGQEVIEMDGLEAVKKVKPQVVVACWLTQIKKDDVYDGNMYGVDEDALMDNVETYIHVGNERVHGSKRILQNPKYRIELLSAPGLIFSRSMHPEQNVIYIVNHATST